MSDLIVYGARCTWWDSIDKAGSTRPPDQTDGFALPCCPFCGSMLFQTEREAWESGANAFEANGHPGYVAMLEFGRGKCFRSPVLLKAAHAREQAGTGETVQ